MTSPVSPRMQDYLEVVLTLQREGRPARVTELADRLGVSKPSVSAGLKRLTDDGLVRHEAYGQVQLTDAGRRVAGRVRERHRLLESFLGEVLGVDPQQAAEDACGIEHHVSGQTRRKLDHFVRFIQTCPRTGRGWLEHFRCSYSHYGGQAREDACAEDCLERCLEEVENCRTGFCREGAGAGPPSEQ